MRTLLLMECEELIAIGFSMITKRQITSTATTTTNSNSKRDIPSLIGSTSSFEVEVGFEVEV